MCFPVRFDHRIRVRRLRQAEDDIPFDPVIDEIDAPLALDSEVFLMRRSHVSGRYRVGEFMDVEIEILLRVLGRGRPIRDGIGLIRKQPMRFSMRSTDGIAVGRRRKTINISTGLIDPILKEMDAILAFDRQILRMRPGNCFGRHLPGAEMMNVYKKMPGRPGCNP